MTGSTSDAGEAAAHRCTSSVLEKLGVWSSHPRHEVRRLWLFMLAMFLPTLVVGGGLVLHLLRSPSIADPSGSADRAFAALRFLLATAIFFAALGGTALLGVRMARIRSFAQSGPASLGGGSLAVIVGGILLLALVPTLVLDLSTDPWIRLAAHLAAPLSLLFLLAGLGMSEAEMEGRRSPLVATLLHLLVLVALAAGVVLLSDRLLSLLQLPPIETWEFIRRFVPDELRPEWRPTVVRLLALEAVVVLAGTLWILRRLIVRWAGRRDAEIDPEWVDRLTESLAKAKDADGRPLLARPPRFRKRSRSSGAAAAARRIGNFACLFPSSSPSLDQAAVIDALRRDHADAIKRLDERTDIESGLETANALVVAEPDSGFEDTIVAAAVLGRLRGQRSLLIVPSESRLDLLAARLEAIFASLAMNEAVRCLRLSHRDLVQELVRPTGERRLPDLLLATRREFDAFLNEHAIGDRNPTEIQESCGPSIVAVNLLSECETVIVDQLEEFEAEDRFAIPFILSLLRMLVRSRGGVEQFVVGVGVASVGDADEDTAETAEDARLKDGAGDRERAAARAIAEVEAAARGVPDATHDPSTALFERLFGESPSRAPRICRLRTRDHSMLTRLDLVPSDAGVDEVVRRVEQCLREHAWLRVAVWRGAEKKLERVGSAARKRWVEIGKVDQLPRFDAIARDCLLIHPPDPLAVGSAHDPANEVRRRDEFANVEHDVAVLESRFMAGRDPGRPLVLIRVHTEPPRPPRRASRHRSPRQLILPERDDALRGLPYLVAAALLLERDTPVRRPLFTDLGAADGMRTDRPSGSDDGLLLLRVDPTPHDLAGPLRGSTDLLPIVWRDHACANRNELAGWLPGRNTEARTTPQAPWQTEQGLLVGRWTRAGSDGLSSPTAAAERFARWRFDSGDDQPVDLLIANDLQFVGERVIYWPRSIARARQDPRQIELGAALWRGAGIETFLPWLRLDSLAIEGRDAMAPPWGSPTAMRLWTAASGRAALRFLGVASHLAPGRSIRFTPLEPPIVIEFTARVSMLSPVIGSLGSPSEEARRFASGLPTRFSMDESDGDRPAIFLPECTRSVAAAFAHRCPGILDCARVLAFDIATGSGDRSTAILFVTPDESGSTVHKTLAELFSSTEFIDDLMRDLGDRSLVQDEDAPWQPHWESRDPGVAVERDAMARLQQQMHMLR